MRKTLIFMYVLGFVIGTMAMPVICLAGECIEEEGYYVEQLEKIAAGGTPDTQDAMYCLGNSNFSYLGMTNRWAGPVNEKLFKSIHDSPYRKRITKACEKILAKGKLGEKKECVEILATYGIGKVGKHDVFLLLVEQNPLTLSPFLAATLKDPRATPILIEQYKQVAAKKGDNKWAKKNIQEGKIAILNAFWHLVDPGSKEFLKDLAENDPDPLIRKRAKRALDHLNVKTKTTQY